LQPSHARSEPVSPSEQLSRLLRERQAELRLPSVSAAVGSRGKVVWQDAIGVADASSGVEPTPEMQYRIGSITKTFTAAAIFELRDEGKLGLDDPLALHVPEAEGSPLTLRRMLAHSSGLQREVPGDVWITLDFPQTSEELIARLREAEQVLDPGAHWHYSNLAYAMLGEVVSRVSGTAVEHFFEDRLLRPLGLTRTTWKSEPPAASPYLVDPWSDVLRPEPEVERSGATAAAGDLWSTPADLCRWADSLSDRDEMHAVQVMADTERWTQAWGLGLALFRRGDRIFFGHGGAMPGFLAVLAWSRSTQTGAAVVTNASTPSLGVQRLGLELADAAVDAFPEEPELWQPGEPPPAELEGVLGHWWAEGTEWIFRFTHGRLEARRDDDPPEQPPSVFDREGPDSYRAVSGRERGERLLVLRDEPGVVSELRWATYAFTREPRVIGG
jgi:CubicO group peptidase (beta-lactamase class C family)